MATTWPPRDDRDAVDEALDRHQPEGEGPGDAVAIAVEGHGLVLVHRDGGMDHAGLEPIPRQGRRRGEVLGEPVLDRERAGERPHDPVAFGLAPAAERGVQLVEVVDAGHGRGEPLLDGLDGALGVGLLVAAGRHAELRLEDVMAGQGRVSRVDLAFAALEDQRGDGPGVIPPDLLGHAAEELEGGDHPFEDGLGPLERQGQDERGVGVGPGGDQERDGPAAVGEVDVDVAEVGLDASSRQVAQGDEGLAMSPPVLEHVALDLGIAAGVGVLVAEAAMDLGGGVPLLGRGVLVVGEDAIDDRLDRAEEGGLPVPVRRGRGLGMAEDMPDGLAGVSELLGRSAGWTCHRGEPAESRRSRPP